MRFQKLWRFFREKRHVSNNCGVYIKNRPILKIGIFQKLAYLKIGIFKNGLFQKMAYLKKWPISKMAYFKNGLF